MAKNECTICRHYAQETPSGELERTNLYDEVGAPVPIRLCRAHSVQLFRLGQKKFLLSHFKILVDLMDSNDPKFIDILEATCRKYPDLVSS